MMKRFTSIVFGLILYVNLSMLCTIPTLNELTVQVNFSRHNFLGSWYKIKWYKSDRYLETDLFNDYYQLFELNSNSTEHLLAYGKGRSNYEQECSSFGPWLINANNSAKMSLEKLNITNTTNLNWPYWILKTDYHHYALIYSCLSENISLNTICQHMMIAVLSRTVLLSNDYLILLDDYIDDILCLSLTQFQIVLHSDEPCEMNVTNGIEMLDRRTLFSFGFLLPNFYFFLLYK